MVEDPWLNSSCGHDTLVCDAYGIKNTKQFMNTLSDNIQKWGAMETLITNSGKYEISKRATDLLRSLFISQYLFEPYHQHQNKSGNKYDDSKHYFNTIRNLSGCPVSCITYVCVLLNETSSPALGSITSVSSFTSPFGNLFYCNIVPNKPDSNFPSQSIEKSGHWVGFAEEKGDKLIWKTLTDDTQKILT